MPVATRTAGNALLLGFVFLSSMGRLDAVDAGGSGKASSGASSSSRPIPARIRGESGWRDVVLVERRGERVYLRPKDAPANVQTAVDAESIRECRFEFRIDSTALRQAERQSEWSQAAAVVLRAVWPALPYLDIADNNAAEPALEAAGYYVRAANALSRAGDAEGGRKEFGKALYVLRAVIRAEWFDSAERARMMAAWALAGRGEVDEAVSELENVAEPGPGDELCGLYWLVQGSLHAAKEDWDAALKAAVRSAVFESKDVETLPDALLLSARCYAARGNAPRARDIHYEVARLFPKTDWGRTALDRLESIMASGATRKKESAQIRKVFFGLDEDMDAKADELVAARRESEVKKQGEKRQ